MRAQIAIAALLALLAMPAAAQQAAVEGNWACRANIDGTKAGILTIFAGAYGYASANFGSLASGTGLATMYSDGVTFTDGNLVGKAGIERAVVTIDGEGHDLLVLSTKEKPVLTCVPR